MYCRVWFVTCIGFTVCGFVGGGWFAALDSVGCGFGGILGLFVGWCLVLVILIRIIVV